ncbi:MAG: hypothetical protein R3C70_06995 [Geminicoccaceae bacterium]
MATQLTSIASDLSALLKDGMKTSEGKITLGYLIYCAAGAVAHTQGFEIPWFWALGPVVPIAAFSISRGMLKKEAVQTATMSALALLLLTSCVPQNATPAQREALTIARVCETYAAALHSVAAASRSGDLSDENARRALAIDDRIGPICEEQTATRYETIAAVKAAALDLIAISGDVQ